MLCPSVPLYMGDGVDIVRGLLPLVIERQQRPGTKGFARGSVLSAPPLHEGSTVERSSLFGGF